MIREDRGERAFFSSSKTPVVFARRARSSGDLATEDGTQDEAGFGEKIQLAAGGACACANVAGDLAKEEGLVGGSEEKRQDLAPGLAEEEVSDEWGGCTHFEYNCTQNEYGDEQNSYSIVPLKPEAGLNGPPVIYFAKTGLI